MREVHRMLREWMEQAGMQVELDAAGNLRGRYTACQPSAPVLLIGSHVDTVPGAGAFDGVLGVVIAIALVETLDGRRLRFGIDIVAFSEEEGVRFGVPFLGSRALVGSLDTALLDRRDREGQTIAQAIREFGLDPARIPQAALRGDVLGFLEFHIEQGPVLDNLRLPLGVVEAIAGQSRMDVRFTGQANHAGTTPMLLRKDALTGAAEWIGLVEREALETPGLVATVGEVEARPGAGNVIAGEVRASLDVRHADDAVRLSAVGRLIQAAREVAGRRELTVNCETRLDQPAVACSLAPLLERAVEAAGYPLHRMVSGAGHDAMILAQKTPVAMLFLRSPGGLSHHPDESVHPGDVDAALKTGLKFLEALAA
jgi:allantoate deiminase